VLVLKGKERRMPGSRRLSSGKIEIALAIALLGIFAIAGWRIQREIRARRTRPVTVQVHGTPIDAPVPAANKAASPAGTPESFPSSGVAPETGAPVSRHDPSRHAAMKPVTFDRDPEAEAEFPAVPYDTLASYVYVMPQKRAEGDTTKRPEQIPESIRALNGNKVCVVGFMLPTVWDDDRITEFLLMRNVPQCCFGVAPQVNEWIVVTMDEEAGSPEHKLTPTAVEGVLEVGEVEVDGWVQSVYRMKAHAVLQTE
jgi:hypothetical protein